MQAISAKSVVNLAMCDMDILSLLSLLKQILLSCGQDLVNRLLNMGQILTNILIFLFNVISFLAATSVSPRSLSNQVSCSLSEVLPVFSSVKHVPQLSVLLVPVASLSSGLATLSNQ